MIACVTRRIAVTALLAACVLAAGCCRDRSCGLMRPALTWKPFRPAEKLHTRSLAIPEMLPLGSVNRAHYHAMETNAEAADFIIHRREFVGQTAELTPDGKDHIVEIAARMRSAPFPVIIERTENNADPELDEHRRTIVAQVLTDFGNPDADQRTIVAPAYGRAPNSLEAEIDYYRFLYSRGQGAGFGNFGNNAGQFGGFGGAGFGGFGFGR